MSEDSQTSLPSSEPAGQPAQPEQTPEPVLPQQSTETTINNAPTPEHEQPIPSTEQVIPDSSAIELPKSETDQRPPEATIPSSTSRGDDYGARVQNGGLSETPDVPTDVEEDLQSPQTETPQSEPTPITESSQQQASETQERVVEKTIERLVPRELNEE